MKDAMALKSTRDRFKDFLIKTINDNSKLYNSLKLSKNEKYYKTKRPAYFACSIGVDGISNKDLYRGMCIEYGTFPQKELNAYTKYGSKVKVKFKDFKIEYRIVRFDNTDISFNYVLIFRTK